MFKYKSSVSNKGQLCTFLRLPSEPKLKSYKAKIFGMQFHATAGWLSIRVHGDELKDLGLMRRQGWWQRRTARTLETVPVPNDKHKQARPYSNNTTHTNITRPPSVQFTPHVWRPAREVKNSTTLAASVIYLLFLRRLRSHKQMQQTTDDVSKGPSLKTLDWRTTMQLC